MLMTCRDETSYPLALFILQAFMGWKIDPSTIVMDFELGMMNADKGM
jgi:hypothetical protein